MADPSTERFVAQVPALLAELERRAEALFGLALTPTLASLPALEEIADFLWQMRERFDLHDRQINLLLLGTYLGEMVRRAEGGAWRVDAGAGLPVVDRPDGRVFRPMEAVGQRLTLGAPPLTALGSSGPGE
ncbi:MAG: hypothetical protein NZ528_06665 [Caldilineales bacterium]|nr:hypothetical protein [Caldilineales bacterium]MDW8318838.1 hypothetical protein [Anaerolineae bacterium]